MIHCIRPTWCHRLSLWRSLNGLLNHPPSPLAACRSLPQIAGTVGTETPGQIAEMVRDKLFHGLAEPIGDLLPGKVQSILTRSLADAWAAEMARSLQQSLVPALHRDLERDLSVDLHTELAQPLGSMAIRHALPVALRELNRGVARQVSDDLVHSFSDVLGTGVTGGLDGAQLRQMCLECGVAGEPDHPPMPGTAPGDPSIRREFQLDSWEDALRSASPREQTCMVCRSLAVVRRRRSAQAQWYSSYFAEYFGTYYSQALVSLRLVVFGVSIRFANQSAHVEFGFIFCQLVCWGNPFAGPSAGLPFQCYHCPCNCDQS